MTYTDLTRMLGCDMPAEISYEDKIRAEMSMVYEEYYMAFFKRWVDKNGKGEKEYERLNIPEKFKGNGKPISALIEYIPLHKSPEEIRANVMWQAEDIINKAVFLRKLILKENPLLFDSQASNLILDCKGREQLQSKFGIWDKAIDVYDLHQTQAGNNNFAAIARQMEDNENKGYWWRDGSDRSNSTNKAKKYFKLCLRLMDAAGEGTFRLEAAKPLPKNF